MGNNQFCQELKGKNREYNEPAKPVPANPQTPTTKARNRRATVTEEEVIVAKIRIQADKIETKNEEFQKKEEAIDAKIKLLISQKKKEEAYHCLVKKKNIRRLIKENRIKLEFLERQVMNIENSVNELGFVNAVKESNRAIEKLNSEMDMEEIRLAKQLQEEGKMRKDELMELFQDDEEENKDLIAQVNDIEKAMVESALNKLTSESRESKGAAGTSDLGNKRTSHREQLDELMTA